MARTDEPNRKPPEEMTFEEATDELESIIEQIESGEIGLETSLAERKRGEGLVKRCRTILDAAEHELQQIKPDERSADAT